MNAQPHFISPKLEGKRFEDHTIPLELLEDFAAFEELLIEVAKWIYLKENPNRKRVPNGFTEGFSLKLASIEEGSSIANIVMSAAIGLFPTENNNYFERAKESIVKSINAAENNLNITQFIPENFLGYFNKIGKNLKEDENINFSNNAEFSAVLNKETRKKLVLASSTITEVITQTKIRGFIPELDKSTNSFTLQLVSGQKIICSIEPQFKNPIFEAFDNYEKGLKVILNGLGKYNKNDKLEGFERIEHMTIIDNLDVSERIEEISKLEDGWLNGEGKSPAKENLIWFTNIFEDNFKSSLPLPYLYPTIDGGLQAEWSSIKSDISIKINLQDKTATSHILELSDDNEIENSFDISLKESWETINTIIEENL